MYAIDPEDYSVWHVSKRMYEDMLNNDAPYIFADTYTKACEIADRLYYSRNRSVDYTHASEQFDYDWERN